MSWWCACSPAAGTAAQGRRLGGDNDSPGRPNNDRGDDGSDSEPEGQRDSNSDPEADNDNTPQETEAPRTGTNLCGCFIAGTDVLTPHGLVDIETIQIGDLVMAWREDGSGYGAYPVSALIRPPSRVIWELTLRDAEGNTEVFETTDDHPWHASAYGTFLRTDELAAGMVLSTQDGDGVTVIEVDKTEETAPTYNLTVADAHTFFVGDDGIWVHNVDCFDGIPASRSSDIETSASTIHSSRNRPGELIDFDLTIKFCG